MPKQLRPLNMPPYPTQRAQAIVLVSRKKELLSEMVWMEKSIGSNDFHDFIKLVKARKELKNINSQLSSAVMANFERTLKV